MICPVFLVLGMFLIERNNFIANHRFTYDMFTLYVAQLFVFIIGPIITSFLASCSVFYEYQQGTLKNLLTSPHSRASILGAKCIQVCGLVLIQYAVVALLCPLLAYLIGIDVTWGSAVSKGLNFCLVGAVTLVVVPIMMLTTFVFRSFVPAMVLAVVGTAANVLALNWDKSYLSPFALPADFLLIFWRNLDLSLTLALTSLIIYTVTSLLLLFIYFIRADQPSA
jgi:bacitracin transport system permease protein